LGEDRRRRARRAHARRIGRKPRPSGRHRAAPRARSRCRRARGDRKRGGMSALVDTLGFIAGTLTTVAFVPQVIKLRRHKRADDLSWWTFGTFTVGVVLWLAYGLSLDAAPIIVV